jgi:hypothetical protein
MRARSQFRPLIFAAIGAWAVLFWFPGTLNAGSHSEARITQVRKAVQLASPPAGTRRARVNDTIGEETLVRTGKEARAELVFSDEIVVRLAANSSFTFKDGTRGLDLSGGAALIQTNKRAKDAAIHAGGVAASVAGVTAIMEYRHGVYKFLVLEGTARLFRPGHFGDSVLVHPGQMVIGNPSKAVSDPVDFDLGRFIRTSCLITDFPALPSEKFIATEIQNQQRQKSNKTLVDTNLVIFGGGTLVSLVGQEQGDARGRGTATSQTHAQQHAAEAAAASQ